MSDNSEDARVRKQHPEESIDLMTVFPNSFGSAMFALEAFMIRSLFRHNTLAVLSVFRDDRSTDENFAERAGQMRYRAFLGVLPFVRRCWV